MNIADIAAKVNAAMEKELDKTTDKSEELQDKDMIKKDNEKMNARLKVERESILGDIDSLVREKNKKQSSSSTSSSSSGSSSTAASSSSSSSSSRTNYSPYGYGSYYGSSSRTVDKEKEAREREQKRYKELSDKFDKGVDERIERHNLIKERMTSSWDIFSLQEEKARVRKQKEKKRQKFKKVSNNRCEWKISLLSGLYKSVREAYIALAKMEDRRRGY